MVVTPSSLLSSTNVDILSTLSHVVGVIALNDTVALADQPGKNLSPDFHVPQGQGTPSEAFTIGPDYNGVTGWNIYANDLAYRSYDLPIVLTSG